MNILIALDGSSNAEECIEELVYFPLTENTNVHLVVVSDDSLLAPKRINMETARQIIGRAREKIAGLYPNLNVSSEVRNGAAASQLLQAQIESKADIILAGAHAPRPFPKEMLESIAGTLARSADCSVRLLRKHRLENRVMVCLENSKIDEVVLAEVQKMYFPLGSALAFLHVLDSQSAELSENPHIDAVLFRERQELTRAIVENTITQHSLQIRQLYPRLNVETLISPEIDAEAVILETAGEWGASTIVVGSHRREGLEKMWLGSVSEPVAAAATCSVHIVRYTQNLHAEKAK